MNASCNWVDLLLEEEKWENGSESRVVDRGGRLDGQL